MKNQPLETFLRSYLTPLIGNARHHAPESPTDRNLETDLRTLKDTLPPGEEGSERPFETLSVRPCSSGRVFKIHRVVAELRAPHFVACVECGEDNVFNTRCLGYETAFGVFLEYLYCGRPVLGELGSHELGELLAIGCAARTPRLAFLAAVRLCELMSRDANAANGARIVEALTRLESACSLLGCEVGSDVAPDVVERLIAVSCSLLMKNDPQSLTKLGQDCAQLLPFLAKPAKPLTMEEVPACTLIDDLTRLYRGEIAPYDAHFVIDGHKIGFHRAIMSVRAPQRPCPCTNTRTELAHSLHPARRSQVRRWSTR